MHERVDWLHWTGVESTPTLYANGRLVRGVPFTEKTFETWLEMAKAGELDPPKSGT